MLPDVLSQAMQGGLDQNKATLLLPHQNSGNKYILPSLCDAPRFAFSVPSINRLMVSLQLCNHPSANTLMII